MEESILPTLAIPDFDDSISEEIVKDFRNRYAAIIKNPRKLSIDTSMIQWALKLEKGMKVLDVGCRHGFQLYELAAKGIASNGLDILPEHTAIVNRIAKANDLHEQVEAVNGDACNMPFKDESFHGIYGFSCFEHIWDKDKAIKECIRVLKPGGRLLICEGNPLYFNSFIRYCFRNYFASRGRYGGLTWLFRRNRVIDNYREGWKGRDEDVHSMFWWMRYLHQFKELEAIVCGTTFYYYLIGGHLRRKWAKMLFPLMPFIGGVMIIAEKRE
jgi:ubiquinone/menaquinone biosynthesis C-methylase UbiE